MLKATKIKEGIRNFYISEIIMAAIIAIVTLVFALVISPKMFSDDLYSVIRLAFISLSAIIFIFGCGYPLFLILLKQDFKTLDEAMEKYNLSEEDIYQEYKTADKRNSLSITNHFTFLKTKMRLKAIPNYDIVWVYTRCESTQTGGKKVYSLIIRTINKKEFCVNFYKKDLIEDCLRDYSYHSHILIGYDKSYDKLYKNHFNEFLDLKYNAE